MRPWGAVGGRGLALALAALLVAAASALAAAHFTPGAVYTGHSCTTSKVKGATCVYEFRASGDGQALNFIGSTVLSGWGCHGAGGEAMLGGKLKYADRIPVIRLKSNGSLAGTAGSGQNEVSVSGRLTKGGNGALVTFHLVKQSCATPQVTLAKQ